MSKARGGLYKAARTMGDMEAAMKGPGAYARRRGRRYVYRHVFGWVGKLLRAVGL